MVYFIKKKIVTARSKDESIQAYLYVEQSENLSDVGLTTNYYKQL